MHDLIETFFSYPDLLQCFAAKSFERKKPIAIVINTNVEITNTTLIKSVLMIVLD